MAAGSKLRNATLAALALALAGTSLPAVAQDAGQAQAEQGRRDRSGERGGDRGDWRGNREARRSDGSTYTPRWGPGKPQAAQTQWNGGQPEQQNRDGRRDDRGNWRGTNRGDTPAETRTPERRDSQGGRADGQTRHPDRRTGDWQRADRQPGDWRNSDRRDNDWLTRDGSRSGWRDGSDRNWNDRDRDARRWDNRWRSDRRYDWQRHRAANRHLYRPGAYHAPYRGWNYRRVGIGFRLDSLFFGNRYWIGDPGYYRLPPVYGPYRWVRYYDDVLLVDIYDGAVVDVIYDFFW